MAGGGQPIPDFGTRGGLSIDGGTPSPFSAESHREDEPVLVHFKVLSDDSEVRRQTAGVIQASLANAKIGTGRGISAIITDAAVEATIIDSRGIASIIAAQVMRILGIKVPA